MRSDITKEVVGRWAGVLAALGVEESFLANKHGPCPMCGGDDRYRFDDKEGRGTWICGQCGAGDGWKLLQAIRGVDFRGAADLVREVLPTAPEKRIVRERDSNSKRNSLVKMWKAAKSIDPSDSAFAYLAARMLMPVPALRFKPSMNYYEDGRVCGAHDAMLAVMYDKDGKGQSIHVTYLQGAAKASVESPRKIMEPLSTINGCAIRLADAGEVLGIAEGIETALSASKIFGVPCWAAATANGVESFQWPESVRELIVFGDNDESFSGHKAAYALAKRARAKGLSVSVEFPPAVGMDWNDVLLERSGAQQQAKTTEEQPGGSADVLVSERDDQRGSGGGRAGGHPGDGDVVDVSQGRAE